MRGFRLKWMGRRDVYRAAAIAAKTGYPSSPRGLSLLLRDSVVLGVSAVGAGSGGMLGFAVFRLEPHRLVVHALAVRRSARRLGVGRTMVHWLLGIGERPLIARVRETDERAWRFWLSTGARAVGVERGWYPDTGEDAYRFELGPPPATAVTSAPGEGGA